MWRREVTGFVTILAALQLAVPVHCTTSEQTWRANLRAVGLPVLTLAYYEPNVELIALGPDACRQVRAPSLMGANILAHELAHHWQDEQGRPMREAEANRIANITDDPLLRRLEKHFGRKARNLEVRLAP
jgi:hypothetical protein